MKKLLLLLLTLNIVSPASALIPTDSIIDMLKNGEANFKNIVIGSGALSIAYVGTWYWSYRCAQQIKHKKNTNSPEQIKQLKRQKWWSDKVNTLSGFLASIGTTTAVIAVSGFVTTRNNINIAAEELNVLVKHFNAITLLNTLTKN